MKLSLVKKIVVLIAFIYLSDLCGVFWHILELDYNKYFHYNVENHNKHSPPSSGYNFSFMHKNPMKCAVDGTLRLTFLIKSAVGNFDRRNVIRKTWGYENRFSDVYIRRVFLLGVSSDINLANRTNVEALQNGDIVQADFVDSYFNNTLKTLMGIHWAERYCSQSQNYMFVDDDYYVSTKNVLRFLDPSKKENDMLFAGYAMQTAPHRHKFSKWFITLQEYPYDMWPPYITAGSFLLSRKALFKMYTTSFSVPIFRFDDIYLGIVALYANILLTHCESFYFQRPSYSGPDSYRGVIASHGFSDPIEMEHIWSEIRSSGYA